jgi:hypothetical protein
MSHRKKISGLIYHRDKQGNAFWLRATTNRTRFLSIRDKSVSGMLSILLLMILLCGP